MPGIPGKQVFAIPHLKIFEIKARGDRTSNQGERLRVIHKRTKPAPGRHNALKFLASLNFKAEVDPGIRAICQDHMQGKRAAGIKMPQFIGLKPVQVVKSPAIKKKINCRGNRPRPAEPLRQALFRQPRARSIRLSIISAIRMGFQTESFSPVRPRLSSPCSLTKQNR